MLDATRKLSDAEVGRLFRGLLRYSMTKEQPQGLQGREEIVFDIYSQQIDRDIEAYERQVEAGRSNGQKGGRPRKNPPGFSETPRVFEKTQKTQDKGKDKGEEKDKGKDKGEGGSKRAREARFTPPSLEDVAGYARQNGWGPEAFCPERFVDFYTAKGWRIGKDPMQDWKAAARSWVSRQRQEAASPSQRENPALDYEQREYRAEDFDEGFFLDLDEYGGEI